MKKIYKKNDNYIVCDRSMYNLESMNYFELIETKKRLEKKYNMFKKGELFVELSNDIYTNILLVKKYINKFNDYRTVKVSYDGGYDYSKKVYTINKAKKKDVVRWLKKNGLNVGYNRYDIDSDYDCTGNMTGENIEIRGDRVVIERWYDL